MLCTVYIYIYIYIPFKAHRKILITVQSTTGPGGYSLTLTTYIQIASTFCIMNAQSVSDSRRKKLRRESRFDCLYISINFTLQTRHHEEFPHLTRCLFFMPPAQICFQCFSHSCIFKCLAGLQLYSSDHNMLKI